MFIMQLTTGRRLGALSVAFLLALIGMVWLAPIAGAHHPDITAQPICNDDGSVSIGWTSLSWMQDPTQAQWYKRLAGYGYQRRRQGGSSGALQG